MAFVENVSARLHVVGGVQIKPGETVEISDDWLNAIDQSELKQVKKPESINNDSDADEKPKRGK